MGALISWDAPDSSASWTEVYIERSTDGTSYVAIASQSISDTDYYDPDGSTNYYYRIRFFDNSNNVFSSYSSVLQPTAVTTYYTDPAHVERFMQTTFSGSTTPTTQQVLEFIEETEDETDYYCGTSWRSVLVTNEYHGTASKDYFIDTGTPVRLNHRNVRAFSSANGDKIEVWEGSWVDYVSTKTESRTGDFWVDYTNGVIYFKTMFFSPRKSNIRVTYHHGESVVPKDIRQAVTMLTAANLLMFEDKGIRLTEGGAGVGYSDKFTKLLDRAYKILDRRSEVRTIGLE